MSAKKTERLLNLVIALLHTRRYLSVQEIRAAVPGYEQDTEESFRRMFERDKEELRELGIPLETGTDSHAHDDEPGYRIARRDYELPEISLEPDEAAALGLAARLWQSAPLAGATGSALLKLRAAGVEAAAPAALEPRVGASEPAFDACLAAVRDGRAVRFAYRTGGLAPQDRAVEPWGVVSWRGRWYLVGLDTGKQAERVFRLSRIVGDVTAVGEPGAVVPPEGLDLRAMAARMATEQPRETARVSAAPGRRLGAAPRGDGQRAGPGPRRLDRRRARLLRPRAARRPRHRLRRRRRRARPARRPRRRRPPPDRAGLVTRPLSGGTGAQLPRLLALVPYLLARPGVRFEQVAADFGVSEDRLRKDLNLLWVCGLPGHGPGDLIDVEFEGDTVTLLEPAGVTRPLRLTVDEALALVVALRALAETPGLDERDAVDRALAKVEQAAGAAAGAADRVEVAVEGEERVLPVVRTALEQRRRLHLSYVVPARDETTERDVDPMRLLLVEGRSYLEAWCRRAEGVRLFRLDRVADVQLLDEPAEPPAGAQPRDVSAGLFRPGPDDLLVTLALRPGAAWVADYHPCESVQQTPDGGLVVRLRARDTAWVRRLVLRLGDQGRVLAPVEVADAVRADAALALSAYSA